jgi:hypothetical protein
MGGGLQVPALKAAVLGKLFYPVLKPGGGGLYVQVQFHRHGSALAFLLFKAFPKVRDKALVVRSGFVQFQFPPGKPDSHGTLQVPAPLPEAYHNPAPLNYRGETSAKARPFARLYTIQQESLGWTGVR